MPGRQQTCQHELLDRTLIWNQSHLCAPYRSSVVVLTLADDRLLVIHAMPLRRKYRSLLP
jgi:hypothetical protein